jgi:hypothetical protein
MNIPGFVAKPTQVTGIKISHSEQALHARLQLFAIGSLPQGRLV